MKFIAFAFAAIFVPTFAQAPGAMDVRLLGPAPPVEQPAAPGTFTRDQRKAATLLATQAGELKPAGEAGDPPTASNTPMRVAPSKPPALLEFPALAAPPQEATAAKPPPAIATGKRKAHVSPSVKKASRAASAATK